MTFDAFKDDCLLPAYNGKNNACLTPRCMTVHYMVNRSNKLIFNTDLLLMCSYKLSKAPISRALLSSDNSCKEKKFIHDNKCVWFTYIHRGFYRNVLNFMQTV